MKIFLLFKNYWFKKYVYIIRSPNKRTTPPQSPPTPHKIELVEDETRRKLRSHVLRTSGDDGIRFVRNSSVKKTVFQNGASPAKDIRTSPKKVEAQEKTTGSTNQVVQTSLNNNNKGPKKKVSFINNDKPTNGSVKSFMPIRRSERRRFVIIFAQRARKFKKKSPDPKNL